MNREDVAFGRKICIYFISFPATPNVKEVDSFWENPKVEKHLATLVIFPLQWNYTAMTNPDFGPKAQALLPGRTNC
jgi:hypothetical protein